MDQPDFPVLTIATISFNQAEFLEQTIVSALEAIPDGKTVDYIVLDGGSTDGSVDIIRRYSDRLYHWDSKPDGGPAAALKEAVEKSRAPWFYYLNADDLVSRKGFRLAFDRISRDVNTDVYYANGYTLNEATGKVCRRVSDTWHLSSYARGTCSIIQQSTFIRRSSLIESGNFNPENRSCWDGEAIFEIARNGGRFCRLPFPVGVFRIHENSITGSQQIVDRYISDRRKIARRIDQTYLHPSGHSILAYLATRLKQPRDAIRRLNASIADLIKPVHLQEILNDGN
ncbi:glycosyltransferase [Crateriforma spongiae]|uniref:glycosyltransferase n=1 Tax=Crateriforma spongiae TaxID=2724528 RepID=UPI001444B8FF|nr:glycosyltransferase [Crateriforma spongiae]